MLLAEHDDVACVALGLDRGERRSHRGGVPGVGVGVCEEIAVAVARDVGGHRWIVDPVVHVVVWSDIRFQRAELSFDLGHAVCAWRRNR